MEKGSGLVKGAGSVTSGFHSFCQMRAYWKREQRFLIFELSVAAFRAPGHYWTKMKNVKASKKVQSPLRDCVVAPSGNIFSWFPPEGWGYVVVFTCGLTK